MTTVSLYNKFIENLGKGLINPNTDTFKAILVSDTYTFDATDEEKADIVGELATANGYTVGGSTIGTPTWGFESGVTKFDGDNILWTATGGEIGPFIGAVIYSDTSIDDKLVCFIDFEGEQTVGDTVDFKITFNVDGILSFTPVI